MTATKLDGLQADATATGPLKLLILQGTPFCNISCKYCFLSRRSDRSRMSVETVTAVVSRLIEDQMVGAGLVVNWHSGEPLVLDANFYRHRVPEFAALVGTRVEHTIQTNATVITDDHCALFQEHDFKIGVSLDGPAFVHDTQRISRSGAATHQQAMVGVERLRKHGIPFKVISVLSDCSLLHPDEMYEFYADLGCEAVGFNFEELGGVNSETSMSGIDFEVRAQLFLNKFWDRLEADGNPFGVREFDAYKSKIMNAGLRTNCQTEPLLNISVGSDGDWSTFCPELLDEDAKSYGNFRFGNVHLGGFRSALTSRRFLKVQRDINVGVEACRQGCEYFGVCYGGNPSNKFAETGTFTATETLACRHRTKTMANFVLQKLEDAAQ